MGFFKDREGRRQCYRETSPFVTKMRRNLVDLVILKIAKKVMFTTLEKEYYKHAAFTQKFSYFPIITFFSHINVKHDAETIFNLCTITSWICYITMQNTDFHALAEKICSQKYQKTTKLQKYVDN